MKRVTLVAVGVIGVVASAAAHEVVWDNGPPDGLGGYSNATVNVLGARRTVLDDFALEAGGNRTNMITELHWQHIWNSFPPGSGSGLELLFRSDAGGAPGNVIATANITSYSEMGTGQTFFGRPGAESWVEFDAIVLPFGSTYWWEATIVGPDNNFWLTKDEILLNPCWVNYDDFGGLQPGIDIFGVDRDLNWNLMGVPAPGAVALLGLAGLAGTRRRRA